jgi:hypothetical protein
VCIIGWVGSCQLPKLPCCFPFTVLMESLVLDVMVMFYATRVELSFAFDSLHEQVHARCDLLVWIPQICGLFM